MKELKIAVAQFEPKDGNKQYNLSVIDKLTKKAKLQGAEVICFHELSVTAYTFCKNLTQEEITNLTEKIPNGESTRALIEISARHNIPVLAGLLEKSENKIYNSYICVDKSGLIARYRKIHPFISPFLSSGNKYVVFNLKGWKCGILICYDNNIIENVRATTLLGAEIIFAPHVTMCTPSPMPGRGFVDDKLWQNRYKDPTALRMEFDGPKGKGWLMRWLPSRAYDNGVYYAFTNPIGYDGEHLKNGNSLVMDPYGEILAEIKSFNNEIAVATITEDKLSLSGGFRYKNARKPELYKDIIGKPNKPVLKPIWMNHQQ
ncbi:MAG: nitrilase [Mariniphaga sp.]|nr:nitrilase [Mariniphaga sp.]